MKRLKKNFIGLIVLLVFFSLLFTSAAPAFAAEKIFDRMIGGFRDAVGNAYGPAAGTDVNENTFLSGLISIVNYLLTFLGVIFFLIVLYAGWHWMTARGNTEEVEKAKKMLQEAVIALIIIFFARLITELILRQIGTIVYS